jgi:hypothetical protein
MFHIPPILIAAGVRALGNWLSKPSQHHPQQLPVYRPPPEYASDFELFSHSLAIHPGITLRSTKDDCSIYAIQFNGITYTALFIKAGRQCTLGVVSNIPFPLDGIPPNVQAMLYELNDSYGSETFIHINTRGVTRILLDSGHEPITAITPDRFINVLLNMTSALAAFDDRLVRHGYRRG